MLAFAERDLHTRFEVCCGWNVRGGRGWLIGFHFVTLASRDLDTKSQATRRVLRHDLCVQPEETYAVAHGRSFLVSFPLE